jgi:hypothetical protein
MTAPIHRRLVLAGGGLAVVLPQALRAAPARGPGIAVTIDDFDLSDTPLMSGEARDAAIRKALSRHRVKAAGFVAANTSTRTRPPGS